MRGADRRGYLTNVTDEEWLFLLPYLLLSREDKGAQGREICRDQTSFSEFLRVLLELWGLSMESGQEQSRRGGWL